MMKMRRPLGVVAILVIAFSAAPLTAQDRQVIDEQRRKDEDRNEVEEHRAHGIQRAGASSWPYAQARPQGELRAEEVDSQVVVDAGREDVERDPHPGCGAVFEPQAVAQRAVEAFPSGRLGGDPGELHLLQLR